MGAAVGEELAAAPKKGGRKRSLKEAGGRTSPRPSDAGASSDPTGDASGSRAAKRSTGQCAWKLDDRAPFHETLSWPGHKLLEWAAACYEEAVAQEKEEALLRRLSGQCNFHVSNLCYRPGTRYLSAAPREAVTSGRGGALGVSSAVGNSSSAPTPLKDGVHFTASMLWEKARKAYKRQRAMVQHPTKATMPSAHPGPYFFRYNGVPNAGEREEVEGKEKSTKKSRSSASLLLGAGGEAIHHVVHLNSVTAQSYVNPRFSVPWKAHLDLITRLNPSMQLEGSLYSSYNAPQGPSQSSLTAGVFIEDLAVKTCDVPWSLIAQEFQQLDADNPEYSFNGDITTSPRHALGSARPRNSGGGGGGGAGAGAGASCRDTKRRASDHDLSLPAEGSEAGAAAAGSPRELHKVDSASYSDLLAPPYREVPFDLVSALFYFPAPRQHTQY